MSNGANKEILQITLSILLAAAVAHVLYVLSINLNDEYTYLWFLFTVGIIAIALLIVTYIVRGEMIKERETSTIDNVISFLKTLLIGIVTIDFFAIIRFVHFLNTESTTYIQSIYNNIWLFAIGACVITMILGGLEYWKNKESKVYLALWILGGILLFFSALFIGISTNMLEMMGALP